MAKTIYLAGPMRSYPQYNFPAFNAAQKLLESQGWRVLNPAQMDRDAGFDPLAITDPAYDWSQLPEGFDMKAARKRAIGAIEEVDAVYMLQDWHKSIGALAESYYAKWCGKQVRFQ